MQIIKRNGETKNYEPEKMEGAIRSAFKSVENSPHKEAGFPSNDKPLF